ncbi:hypothetical protein MKQ70_32335 [Chitinophaga sedimenti]|uniref:hypothetical protein n=1 Tax=Chitinophaga sedimenti TaxID=2033606 RepID=UPI002004AB6D|nr:hypothetical protein [Chitinophaga sedimenti]MCK7559406.1 hypothetical protein [Chitinophaga sedimenti]
MKKIVLWAAAVLLITGCSKDFGPIKPAPVIPLVPVPIWPWLPKNITLAAMCVNSYQDATTLLGTTPLPAVSVELESGLVISIDATILSINYMPVGGPVGNSLFTSRLVVTFNVWGYEQFYTSDVWSLGCELPSPGGVLTNVRKGGLNIRSIPVLSGRCLKPPGRVRG